MATKIAWTDETWNPIVGCSHCSPGCDNCYAERMACRLAMMGQPTYKQVVDRERHANPAEGCYVANPKRWNGKTTLVESALTKPLHWRKPRRVFVCSMADVFHPTVAWEWINKVWAVMLATRWHTFMVLTKRPHRMAQFFAERRHPYVGVDGWKKPAPNVWLGVTVCNQAEADAKIPTLLHTPAAVRFVSIEPMLGPVTLRDPQWLRAPYGRNTAKTALNWVICGGESGPRARPMEGDWARSLRDQCKETGVPFFFKQRGSNLSEWGRVQNREALDDCHAGEKGGHLLDGNESREWPATQEDLF